MNKQFTIKPMTIEDYDGLHALWMTIHGFGIRSIDDSREGVERFINRNPGTSVVAIGEDGAVVGGILCGHDGRRGCLYCTMYVSEKITEDLALAKPWSSTA